MNFKEVIDNIATKNAIKRAANIGEDFRGKVSKEDLLDRKSLFLNEKRITDEFNKYDENYDFQRFLFYLFLNKEDFSLKDDLGSIVKNVKEFKNYLTKNEKYIHLDEKEGEIYGVILDTILEDRHVSPDELNVLEKLRKKLGVSDLHHWIFRIKNNMFDEVNKIEKRTDKKLRECFRKLERKGLLFYINKDEGRYYIIPEEIVRILKNILGLELQHYKYEKLLDNPVMRNEQKRDFLRPKGIDPRGNSDELNLKIIFNALKPSEFLDSLTIDDLYRITGKLGLKKSGSKKTRISRIIKHYDRIYMPTEKLKDEREIYYKFYEDLANRNQSELIKRGVIKKGEEIGIRFEEATKYLFEKVLGFTLKDPKIKDRHHGVKADGKAIKGDNFIIWDCKTKDKHLSINTPERRQFQDYISKYRKVDPGKKFISFLIITPDIKNPVDIRKQLIDIKNETDVDISVVKAMDLKEFADKVNKLGVEMDLKPFHCSQIVDYGYLESFISKR